MTWYSIPVSPVPYQTVSAVINGQNYRLTIRHLGDFLYSSVNVDGEQVSDNAIAVANGKLIPFPTAVAKTTLYWFDTLGNDRPKYTGLGNRWQIVFKGE